MKKYNLNIEQQRFWIKKPFIDGTEYTELYDNECFLAPQAKSISKVVNPLRGNSVRVVNIDYDGNQTVDKVFKVGQWNFQMIDADSIEEIFSDEINVVLAVEINGDFWRTAVTFKDGEVDEIVSMNMEDDTEIILYSKGKPVKKMVRKSKKNGKSISNSYTLEF